MCMVVGGCSTQVLSICCIHMLRVFDLAVDDYDGNKTLCSSYYICSLGVFFF